MHFQWESWNTSLSLSVDELLRFIVQTTSLDGRQPPNIKRGQKGAWPGSCDPVNFWALNANRSKTAKDTNFKFGKHAPMERPNMTPVKFFEKGRGQGHVTA